MEGLRLGLGGLAGEAVESVGEREGGCEEKDSGGGKTHGGFGEGTGVCLVVVGRFSCLECLDCCLLRRGLERGED